MNNHSLKKTTLAIAIIASPSFLTASQPNKGSIEVLHWWTSGGEKQAKDDLQQKIEKKGFVWKDFKIDGGGGDNALKVLEQRVISGNPPEAVQIKGPEIQRWGPKLTDINEAAKDAGFDNIIPIDIKSIMKFNGNYVAVPVNVHRVDWVWANKVLIEPFLKEAADIKGFDKLLFLAKKLKKQGKLPFAHGGQSWQDATAFEAIALSVGGPSFYRKAFVDLDLDTLKGPTMVKVFNKARNYVDLLDPNRKGLEWSDATKLVYEGKAAMQLMGDWAKGEFLVAQKKPDVDFMCFPIPSDKGLGYLFNVDSFVFFKNKSNKGNTSLSQSSFAKEILAKDFQLSFNMKKGSIPVRKDIDMKGFDTCAKKSFADFSDSKVIKLPSWAHKMAVESYIEEEFSKVITTFFNTPSMTSTKAATLLAIAAEEAYE